MSNHTEKTCFYLKINRMEGYTIRNLKRWLMIISHYGADSYIQCDNSDLMEKVKRECIYELDVCRSSAHKCVFIESNRSDERLREIVHLISDNFWENAAYAHLTTFLHALENGYTYFWNIDADDTRIMLSAERSCELLRKTEEIAIKNGVQAISLDMWASRLGEGGWSFGITYVDNKIDWFSLMTDIAHRYQNEKKYNIDRFFRYIKKTDNRVSIATFYAENLKFLHYSNDFYWRSWESGLYHWHDGRLIMPILLNEFGLEKAGNLPIVNDAFKVDIRIKDEESQNEFVQGCKNPEFFMEAPGKV